ncbi:uncharacterized protein [Eucyclogobius newberryi]|uniref:uncharacterized protein n=1 Tax=Eucyclogobius newberryi TaxID=166745 RepID=UPI003B5C33EB
MESSHINETGNGPGEAEESDSGDSIFFTQKTQKSIDIGNVAGSPLCSQRSKPLSPRFLESGSSSEEDVPEKRKRHPCLPKYNFPFLNQRRSQGTEEASVSDARNRAIHYCGVAGFFSCVREMWSSGQRRHSFESTLPTVDADNEEITPITEDEKSDEEDFKIIDKRTFVYSLKPKITKSSQPWFKTAKTTKPSRKSQQHAGTKNTLQATSNKPKALANDKHLDSSDPTLVEIHEPITPRSFADAHIYKQNLTHVNEVTVHGNGMSESDESNTESQSILQNQSLDIIGRHRDTIYNTNGLLSTKINPGEKKLENQESDYLFEDYIMKYPSPHRRKNETPRKTNSNNLIITESKGDIAEKRHSVKCGLETSPITKSILPICNLKKDIQGQSSHEETGLLLCANVEGPGDGTVQKNKKKKHKKKKAEEKQNGTHSNSLPFLDDGKCDNIPTVDEASSDMSNLRRKKNRKVSFDEVIALKQLPLHYTGENSSSGLFESHGNCELPKNGNSGTDSITIPGASESVKKRKKKRKVPHVAETVENVTLHLSLSGEGHGADGPIISTNDIESAETKRPLQETELGNKRKKKKNREKYGELANTDPKAKVKEMTNMSECNKSKDCESTEVIQHPCDEGYHMKKKKKKASQSTEKTAPEATSPNPSECSERKKKGKKQKRQHCEDVEMEAEHSAVKKKTHKNISVKDDQIVSTLSHVEILPSLVRLKKSSRTKAKKRLYNPNETFMDSF